MSLCPLVKEEQQKDMAEALQRDFPVPPKRRAMLHPTKHCHSFFLIFLKMFLPAAAADRCWWGTALPKHLPH